MKSKNVLVALAIVQLGTHAAPAFARAGFGSSPTVSTPDTLDLRTPPAPVKPTKAPALVPTDKLSSICPSLLSLIGKPTSGYRMDAYQIAPELAVPREQVSRLLDMGPDESLKARLLRKFKALLGRAERPTNEVNFVVPDIGDPDIDLESKRVLQHVLGRIDELQSDSYQKPDSVYLMRHSLHGRGRIKRFIDKVIREAVRSDKAFAEKAQPKVDATEPVVVPVVDLSPVETPVTEQDITETAEAELPFYPYQNFPYNIDWNNVRQNAKLLGGATLAGLGAVVVFRQDPAWMLSTIVGVGAGVAFMSANVRDQLGQFKGRVRALWERVKNGAPVEPEDPAVTLAKRTERTRLQINVMKEISNRLAGHLPETGLSYYAYVAEVPYGEKRPKPVKGQPKAPAQLAGTNLALVEHIVYTNLNSHRMLTFVSKLTEPTEPYTEVSLVHK